ncbi:MAG: hypothetical protein Ct9H90mP16_21390 [Candidatus Poseidoniales archaeon]|nr:MAG: hypothetical protein Ct9H90mP16_21390 [Candidatus Poseidoniales archaeon]
MMTPFSQALAKASESEGVHLTDRLMENLAEGVRSRGKAKLTPAQAKKIFSAAGLKSNARASTP